MAAKEVREEGPRPSLRRARSCCTPSSRSPPAVDTGVLAAIQDKVRAMRGRGVRCISRPVRPMSVERSRPWDSSSTGPALSPSLCPSLPPFLPPYMHENVARLLHEFKQGIHAIKSLGLVACKRRSQKGREGRNVRGRRGTQQTRRNHGVSAGRARREWSNGRKQSRR